MSEVTPPKKPRKPRLPKRLNVSVREKWERLLKDVEKNEVPITCLDSLVVNLIDGTSVTIIIKELLDDGNNPEMLEIILRHKLKVLDAYIKDVDFYINVDSVAKEIQPITDKILKDL